MRLFNFYGMFSKSDDRYFDEASKAVKSRGRFDVKQHSDDCINYFNYFRTTAQTVIDYERGGLRENGFNKMPYVHFDFIDDPFLNASAFRHAGREYIGINYGTILLLQDIFYRMLARKDILVKIGTPTIEVNPEPLDFLAINYDVIRDFHKDNNIIPEILPKDRIRLAHAELLTEFAILFLIDHELAHLRNGHHLFIRNKTGQSFITEFNESIDDIKLPQLTRKVLEWDADCCSAVASMNRMMDIINSPEQFVEIKKKSNNVIDDVLFHWNFSIWVLFRLMYIVETKSSRINKYYPSPDERQLSVWITAKQQLERLGYNIKTVAFKEMRTQSVTQSEKALALIAKETSHLGAFQRAGLAYDANPKNTYYIKFEKHWREVVRPELVPLARGANLPD